MTPVQLALGMLVFTGISCLAAVGLINDAPSERAVLVGALLATSNGLGALLLSHIGASQSSTKAFFQAVLGGMAVRMGITLAGFVFGLKVLMLPAIPFAAALLAYTGLFTAAEVTLWSRQNFSPRVRLS